VEHKNREFVQDDQVCLHKLFQFYLFSQIPFPLQAIAYYQNRCSVTTSCLKFMLSVYRSKEVPRCRIDLLGNIAYEMVLTYDAQGSQINFYFINPNSLY